MDKYTNRSKGFGFVEMPDDAAAQKAIAELDGGMVEGRAIKVMIAKPKDDKREAAESRLFLTIAGNRFS